MITEPRHTQLKYSIPADNSNNDALVVIYWTMTGTDVVPGRQQYDEHTHQADMIPGVSISYQTAL